MTNSNLHDLEEGELDSDAISIFIDLLHRRHRILSHTKDKKFFEPNDSSHEYTMMLIDQEIFGTSSGLIK